MAYSDPSTYRLSTMYTPRILITTYHKAFLVRGGGEYEIFTIAESLKRLGYIADIYSPYSRSIDNYDVIINFSVHGGGIELLREIKKFKKPIILWPNLWVTNCNKQLATLVNEHVEISDAVIFKSQTERDHFSKRFSLPESKTFLTLFSVDPSYTKSSPPGLFKNLYNLDQYAIWFGVIEKSKNQLSAIQVLNRKNIPLVLVGRYRDKDYFDKCRDAAKNSDIFIEGLPQKSEIVRSALRESLFYIEIPYEPPGLSAIEAGLCGCKLLLSDNDWSKEHFNDLATYTNPDDHTCISRSIDKLLSRPHDPSKLINQLTKHCLPESIKPLTDVILTVLK